MNLPIEAAKLYPPIADTRVDSHRSSRSLSDLFMTTVAGFEMSPRLFSVLLPGVLRLLQSEHINASVS